MLTIVFHTADGLQIRRTTVFSGFWVRIFTGRAQFSGKPYQCRILLFACKEKSGMLRFHTPEI
jgi:hypothetical protein